MTDPTFVPSDNGEPTLPAVAILERISDGFYALDDTWRFTYVNREAERLLNRTRAELLGTVIWDEFPEARGTNFDELYHQAVATQEAVSFETYYVPFAAWFEVRAYPGPGGLSIYFRDITVQRAVEAEQHAHQELLTRIIETIADGISIVNVDGRLTFANAAAERILGLNRSQVRARRYDDPAWKITAIDGRPMPQTELPFVRVMATGQPVYGVEHAIEHPNGRRVLLQVNAAPLTAVDGTIIGIVSSLSDITARKQTEVALRASEEHFRTIYVEAPIGVIVVDPDNRLLRANPAFCSMVGYAEEELQALSIDDITHPDDRETSEALRSRMRTGELPQYHLQKRYIARDGSLRWGNLTSSLIQDEHGGVLYGIGMIDDITAEKQAGWQIEAERRRVAYDLHDGLAQIAVSLHLRLQAFAGSYPPSSRDAIEELASILDHAQLMVREARHFIAGLRPTVLDDVGLAAALRLQIGRLHDEGWVITYDEALGPGRLPAAVETALFWVAQEALTNIRKHAGIRQAQVILHHEGDVVRLEILDEGQGFDPSAPVPFTRPGEQIGLLGMRERIMMLGGICRIESVIGAGTSVRAIVPLDTLTFPPPKEGRSPPR